jgi:low affinity Fe/Cu permease
VRFVLGTAYEEKLVVQSFAKAAERATGRPAAFILAFTTIIVWAITGPFFRFSDTWQLVINTGTTIVTFLMVFLIQNTQNRDSEAVQIKLDESIVLPKERIRHYSIWRNWMTSISKTSKNVIAIAAKSRAAIKKGQKDTGTPFVHLTHLEEAPAK